MVLSVAQVTLPVLRLSMLCCCSTPVYQDSKPLVVDLCEILKEKAWRNFRSSHGPIQRFLLRRNNFIIEVPENYFDFVETEQTITPSKKVTIKTAGDHVPSTKNDGKGVHDNKSTEQSRLLKEKGLKAKKQTFPELVSLDTEFRNETAEQQLYKFRFEKTRKTEFEVSFQKGVTLGGKANFKIGIPFGELETEAEIQYQVTKSEGQKFEESMVMEATSDIAVGPNSCYTANVQLEEKDLHATFKIISRLTLPQGRAPVYIKRKSDGQKVFVYYIKNLVDTFKDSVPCAEVVKDEEGMVVVDKLDFVIEGVIKGTLACHHKILLSSNESEETKNKAKVKYLQEILGRPVDRRNNN